MADVTGRYGLPLMQSGQAQKEVTHNAAVARVDALLHLAVLGRTANLPPPAPVAGSSWIVGPAPAGVWSGRAGSIAVFDDSGWSFVVPRPGCLAFVVDEGIFIARIGNSWNADWPVHALQISGRTALSASPVALPALSGGSVVDTQARAAIEALTQAMRGMGLVAAT